MSKVLLTSLDPRIQKQVANAEQQLRSNPSYAVGILPGIVARNPQCVEIRRLLRSAQRIITGKTTSGGGLAGLFGGLAGLFGGNRLAEKEPLKAIEKAEEALAKNPVDLAANKLLAAAAEKLGWLDTAAFAYECITKADPKTPSNFINWCVACFKSEDLDEALRVADDGLGRFPGNGDLQEIARKASVAKTVQKGKWEASDDYKSKIKDLDAAAKLDSSNRIVQDTQEALRIAAELEQKIATDPENVDYYREAVRNYQAAGELAHAIELLGRARQTNIGRADAALEKQENELKMLLRDQNVAQLAQRLETEPDNAALRAEYEEARTSAATYRLDIFQNLVDRYPNDYGYRYNLGVLLLETGRNDDAIQQLQVAMRNPKNRHNAMLNLARAFIKGGKFDLAVEQLQTAKGEIQVMSDIKKEIIYELGSALEKVGRDKEAGEEYKSLYMADSSYKDISQKINDYYAKTNK
ncbi:MAG: tetratricopeptide repeat protein [Puniceicoccales bacterium]|jgi:tetratricopeptide (TPR) repeat protein|nr:tetratricopeptide repeat protein [Puniceicoccales bacterium]